MSSSRGTDSQDLDGYSKNPPSFSIGSDVVPNNIPRQQQQQQQQPQNFTHPTPLSSDMGLRIAAIADVGDDQFGLESAPQHNPVYSHAHDANLPRSTSSIIPLSPYPHVYNTVSGSSSYPTSGAYFSPNVSPFSVPDHTAGLRYHASDIRPSLPYQQSPDGRSIPGTYTSSPTMAPPTRSPNLSHLNNPISAREIYTGQAPQLRRSDLLSRSPSASGNIRGGPPLSPSPSSGLASPANMENPNSGPPLTETEYFAQLRTLDGQSVSPEILGKVDKGFFRADGDWTCYRRNYFQLSCSYTLHPWLTPSNVLVVQNNTTQTIHGFSMTISAVVDSRDGRPIELVQHTPKRDKGPQMRPDRMQLAARPHPPATTYGSSGDGISQRAIYDSGYPQSSNQMPIEHTYERIQFKCATANNGRRRAAQQYYHLIVELHADLGLQLGDGPERYIKVAQRVSAPVVVRGRSPGHYHSERRHSNASAGGNAGPGNGGGNYESSNSIHRSSVQHMSLPGSSSMVPGSGYNEQHYDQRTAHYSRSNIEVPMDPIMSAEEIKAIDESEGYLYYPSPLYEGIGISLPHVRSQLEISNQRGPHPMGSFQGHGNSGPRIKQEPGSSTGYNLPSLTAGPPAEYLGRHFGRFDGLPSSKGYYPTVFTHSDLNSM